MLDINALASSSKGNCYIVDNGGTQIMLDCGIRWDKVKQLLNFKTSNIEACLISHSHGDHVCGLNGLIKSGIDVYLSQQTILETGVTGHRIHMVDPLKQFIINEWTILPFELQHDVMNVGYLLSDGNKKIVYITDSYFCRYKFSGLTHILIECNYDQATLDRNVENGFIPEAMKNRLIRSHFSLENVVEFLKANDLSKVEQIIVLHLSSGNANEKLIKETIQQVTGKYVVIAG